MNDKVKTKDALKQQRAETIPAPNCLVLKTTTGTLS